MTTAAMPPLKRGKRLPEQPPQRHRHRVSTLLPWCYLLFVVCQAGRTCTAATIITQPDGTQECYEEFSCSDWSLSSSTCEDVETCTPALPALTALAAAMFDPIERFTGSFWGIDLTHIGPTGADGLFVQLPPGVGRAVLDLAALDLNVAGRAVSAAATVAWHNDPSHPLGLSSLSYSALDEVGLSADFSTVGATTVDVRIYANGAPVGSIILPNGNLGVVRGHATPRGVVCNGPGYHWQWDSSITYVSPLGDIIAGNAISVAARDVIITQVTTLSITARNLQDGRFTYRYRNPVASVPPEPHERLSPTRVTALGSPIAPVSLACVLPRDGPATVQVFSVTGRLIRTIFEGVIGAGETLVSWDGRDADGRKAAAGMYCVRLTSGSQTATGNILLLR